MFIAEVLLSHVNENCLNEKEQLDLEKMQGVAYGNGSYYQIKSPLGYHGYSQRRPRE